SNTYEGQTLVNAGILGVSSASALGIATVPTTVAAGASLLLPAGPLTVAEPIILSGTGFGGGGALVSEGANTRTGTITLGPDSTINVTSGTTLVLSGSIRSSDLNRKDLTKTGVGTLTLAGSTANSSLIDTHLDQGFLRLAKSVADGAI